MKCPKCETEYQGDFCPNCNTPAQNSEISVPENPRKKFYKKWWFWLIIAVLVIAIASGASQEFKNDGETASTLATASSEGSSKHDDSSVVSELDEEAYKSECGSISFNDLARNPDSLKGNKYKIKGKVIQVIEPTFGNTVQLRIDITHNEDFDYWSDTIYAEVEIPKEADRILEDDIITIWGECDGLYSYKTVLGAKESVPKINIKYYQIG